MLWMARSSTPTGVRADPVPPLRRTRLFLACVQQDRGVEVSEDVHPLLAGGLVARTGLGMGMTPAATRAGFRTRMLKSVRRTAPAPPVRVNKRRLVTYGPSRRSHGRVTSTGGNSSICSLSSRQPDSEAEHRVPCSCRRYRRQERKALAAGSGGCGVVCGAHWVLVASTTCGFSAMADGVLVLPAAGEATCHGEDARYAASADEGGR